MSFADYQDIGTNLRYPMYLLAAIVVLILLITIFC